MPSFLRNNLLCSAAFARLIGHTASTGAGAIRGGAPVRPLAGVVSLSAGRNITIGQIKIGTVLSLCALAILSRKKYRT